MRVFMTKEEKTEESGVKFWFNELDEAKKRDKEYHKEGQRIVDIYECDDIDKVPFNILYSNTDTLLPALYSQVPAPKVQSRFKDDDPMTQAACTAAERMLEYVLDTNIDGYETFHEGVQSAVIDALLPGRGATRIKYDAEIGEYLEQDGETESEPIDGDQEEDAQEPGLRKESELVCVDALSWDRVLFGYAKKWSNVPWVAFEEIIDKDEAIRLFGKEIANKIKFSKGDEQDDDNEHKDKDEHQGGRKTATIYQIWDKDGGRKVRYVSKHYKDDYLKVEDDPLELTGFYPMPKPLVLLAKSNSLEVTAPYLIYENQAKELNDLTRRINRTIKAIKAKAIYDAELGDDLENIVNASDNVFIPADKSSMLSSGGFDKALWFMPIQQLTVVLKELYAAREACKQVIYEVTGISDIIRGSTVASETATAQNIKSQWGTMRLKRNQGEVQRYARDMLRIILEVAATKFSEETWVQMTGLPYATEQQVAQAQQVMQAAQQVQAQMQSLPQGQAPQIPPQAMQAFQQAQQTLQQPQWSQILELLKSDMQRSYKIDIETNSTISPEATADKQNMNEALQALSGFIKESLPVVQSGLLPFDGFKAILLKIARQFEFGTEIEDVLKTMQAPPPPQPPPVPPDNTLQVKQLDIQAKQAADQAKNALEMHKIDTEKEVAQGQAMLDVNLEKMRQSNAQGQAMLDVQLEKLRIENAKLLEIFRLDSARMIKQMELNAARELEELRIANAPMPPEQIIEPIEPDEPQEPHPAIMEALNTLTGTHDQTNLLLAAMNRPKRIIRGEDGRPEGIE